MQRSVLRVLSLLLYAAVTALAEALVARPALLFLRGLGIFEAVLPWRVPFGAVQLLLALGIASCGLLLGVRVVRHQPRLRWHATLLALLAFSLCVRGFADEPRPPLDPLPALLTGLQVAAGAVERSQAAAQPLDTAAIDAELSRLDPPGFVRLGRRLPMRAAISPCAGLRQPGTICILAGARRAELRVLTLHGVAILPDGKPAVIEVRGGNHTVPGRDPLLPAYPGMRSLSAPNAQPP